MPFQLVSKFKPRGDQPQAIRLLVDSINARNRSQTLLGVTGSGKTFTMANVVQQLDRPTLVISHNKTLAAQLFSEFKQFFPPSSISSATTITTSLKRTFRRPTPTSRKTPASMSKLKNCGSRRRVRCCHGAM